MNTKYVTLDDIREYAGVDLTAEIGSTEQALAFLSRIEIRTETFLDARMHQSVERRYPELTDTQKAHYKMALMEQAIYTWRNGDLSVDAGYDPSEGMKADQGTLLTLTIARNAKEHLMLAGLWTYKLGPHGWSFGNLFNY